METLKGTIPTAPGGIAKLFVAWCGDSRALLIRGRTGFRCSEDHRPTRTDEQERIRRAGGRVMKDPAGVWRVGPREENKYAQELEKGKKERSGIEVVAFLHTSVWRHRAENARSDCSFDTR